MDKTQKDKRMFWESMMKKHEERNNELRQKGRKLRHRLESMGCSVDDIMVNKDSVLPPTNKRPSFDNSTSTSTPNQELSVNSINLDDVVCMQKLLYLIEHENILTEKIKALENKEKALAETQANPGCNGQALPQAFPGMGMFTGLMSMMGMDTGIGISDDNQALSKKLSEVQKELKMCMENIEGPMALELESEKSKSRQLQLQLIEMTEALQKTQNEFQRSMCEMKMQLHCTCTSMLDVNSQNLNLKKQVESLNCRCNGLRGDLVRQKLNEAETIRRFSQKGGYVHPDTRQGAGDKYNSPALYVKQMRD